MSHYRGESSRNEVKDRQKSSGVPLVQQNQEFNLQIEEFPALPGDKGGNSNNPMDLNQKEQLHDNAMSVMHSQNVSMGRSSGSNLGATYSSHLPQHTPSTGGLQGLGPRPLSSLNAVSSISYDQPIQQYQQQHQNQSQNISMGRSSVYDRQYQQYHNQPQNFYMGRSSDYDQQYQQYSQYQQHQQYHNQPQNFYIGRSIGYDQQYPQQYPQHQNFYMGGSGGFNLGATYSSHRPQHTPSGLGLRPLSSPNAVYSIGYEQPIQQYQQHQNQSQLPVQQMSSVNQLRDSEMKPAQSEADPFSLVGLVDVLNGKNPELSTLAIGFDLTTLGLDVYSTENIYKTFASPWSNEPAKSEVEFTLPNYYYATPPPHLTRASFKSFSFKLLFYIFYSMPKDEAQLFAADELYERGWLYDKELKFWFLRVGEPLVSSAEHERGTYDYFDPTTFEIVRTENFVFKHEFVEKRSSFLQH